MKRTIFISMLASAALCAAILIAQYKRNQALDSHLAELRTTASETPDPEAPGERSSHPATSDHGIKPGTADPDDSQKRVVRAAKDLSRRLSLIGDTQSGFTFLRVLPAAMTSIGHLDIEEAINVADQLGTGSIFPPEDASAAARLMLYLLAAEHEPLKILERKDLELDSPEGGMEEAVFGMLARKDPDAALRWLDANEMHAALKKKRQFDVAVSMLAKDPRRSLDFLAENPSILPGGGMGQRIAGPPMTEEAKSTLFEALPEPRYAEIRPALAQLVLSSSAATTSIAELRQQTQTLQLSTNEIATFLRNNSTTLIQSDPADASAWMKKALPADHYADSMALAIRQWTERDFNAAGTFLGTMEHGPARDQSIHEFADTVANMEPESAALWAKEIDDPNLRQSALREVSESWLHLDPNAARAWMKEQGIPAPDSGKP